MISRFFIYRPIFAGVLSILIVLAGGITIPFLPIEQTPDITPPTVSVKATYPGASATVIAETLAVPIENEVNGVEDAMDLAADSPTKRRLARVPCATGYGYPWCRHRRRSRFR